jgi:hypothetical protein
MHEYLLVIAPAHLLKIFIKYISDAASLRVRNYATAAATATDAGAAATTSTLASTGTAALYTFDCSARDSSLSKPYATAPTALAQTSLQACASC